MSKGRRPQQNDLPPEVVAKIRADIARWRPGLFAEENGYGPACRCGRRNQNWHAEGGGIDDGRCFRHEHTGETQPDTQVGDAATPGDEPLWLAATYAHAVKRDEHLTWLEHAAKRCASFQITYGLDGFCLQDNCPICGGLFYDI